jgi:hypothetical protein
MARLTLVGIEAGTEAIVAASRDGLDFSEPDESILKESVFIRRKTWQGIAGTRRAAPHPGVDGRFQRLSRHANARRCQNRGNESFERFAENLLSRGHEPLLSFTKEKCIRLIRI